MDDNMIKVNEVQYHMQEIIRYIPNEFQKSTFEADVKQAMQGSSNPNEMTPVERKLTQESSELRQRLLELTRAMHFVRSQMDLVEDMDKKVRELDLKVDAKSTKGDLLGVVERIDKDFPTIKAFGILQNTVEGKAEWMDLNRLAQQHNNT